MAQLSNRLAVAEIARLCSAGQSSVEHVSLTMPLWTEGEGESFWAFEEVDDCAQEETPFRYEMPMDDAHGISLEYEVIFPRYPSLELKTWF